MKNAFYGELAYIWRIWGEAELILRIWGAKENTFRELRNFLSGIWGDQFIIFSDQGSTDPPGGLTNGKVTISQLNITNKSQEVSAFYLALKTVTSLNLM